MGLQETAVLSEQYGESLQYTGTISRFPCWRRRCGQVLWNPCNIMTCQKRTRTTSRLPNSARTHTHRLVMSWSNGNFMEASLLMLKHIVEFRLLSKV